MRALCIRGLGASGSRALAISGVMVHLSPHLLSAASIAITVVVPLVVSRGNVAVAKRLHSVFDILTNIL